MNIREILSKVDHTLLKQPATENEIKKICEDAIKFKVFSVCIPPSYASFAANLTISTSTKVCTVIGFPNGYNTTETKIFETENAIKNGAKEIDMVVNMGWIKDNEFKKIENEIKEIKKKCETRTLKVIIETCLLSEKEKIKMCEIVTNSQADYIKTSTGFSSSGATFEDIKLFKKYVGHNVKIKAAGGIKTLEDAEKFINLGAERLGTSKIIDLARTKFDQK